MEGKACKKCRIIITRGEKCPICGGNDLTTKWSSYVIMLNAEKSEIAKILNININSIFAINIRE